MQHCFLTATCKALHTTPVLHKHYTKHYKLSTGATSEPLQTDAKHYKCSTGAMSETIQTDATSEYAFA